MANVARVEATITAQNKLRPGLSSAARDLDKFRAAQTKATRAFAASASQIKGMERMERVMGSLQRGAVALGGLYALQRAGQAIKEATVRFAEVDRAMTRTGITGDAMAEEVRKGTEELRNLARDTATMFDPAQKGLDAITASGREFGDAMKMMPSVLKTAQASGAGVDDIANSSTALIDHMKISIEGLSEAQDTLAMGGKLGKFELKDMARYLPSMLPAFKALGQTGQEGLRKLVAMLQVIRSGTGTAEEAAASAQNIFSKMESDQTVKNFKEMGVDLPKALAKARKEGKDLMEVFLQLSNKALKGDLSKLPQLFQDMEVQRGMRPLLTGMAKLVEYQQKLKAAGGTIDTDFKRVAEDTRASLDRFSEGADRAKAGIGGLAAELASPAIKAAGDRLNELGQAFERASEAARNEGFSGALKKIREDITASGQPYAGKPQDDIDQGRQADAARQVSADDATVARLAERRGYNDLARRDPTSLSRDEIARQYIGRRRQGAQPGQTAPDLSEDEIKAVLRDQQRRSGAMPDSVSFTASEMASAVEGVREARRAAGFGGIPGAGGPSAPKGLAQRGGVLPPSRPKAAGAPEFPGFGDDAKSRFKVDNNLPNRPEGNVASNSLFSGERLAGQNLDPKLTKTAMPSFSEMVGEAGSAASAAGQALATGLTPGLETMKAQVAAAVADMQATLNSLKAPSLSLGGFNTGKGMAEVR